MKAHLNDNLWNYMMTSGHKLSFSEICKEPIVVSFLASYPSSNKDEFMVNLLKNRIEQLSIINKNIFKETSSSFNNMIRIIDNELSLIFLDPSLSESFKDCPTFLKLQKEEIEKFYASAYEQYQHNLKIVDLSYQDFKQQINPLVNEKVDYFRRFKQNFAIDAKRVELALKFGNRLLFEYDFANHQVILGANYVEFLGIDPNVLLKCDSLLDLQDYVLPQSLDEFKKFNSLIMNGYPSDEVTIGIRNKYNNNIWVKLFYELIKDTNGKVIWLIGYCEQVTEYSTINFAFNKIEQFGSLNQYHTILRLRLNLNTNNFLFFWTKDVLSKFKNYDEFYHFVKDKIAYKEEAVKFERNFALNNLIVLNKSGADTVALTFRADLGDGKIEWYVLTGLMAKNPLNQDVYIHFILQKFTRIRKFIGTFNENTKLDYVTHLYTADTTKKLVNHYLSLEKNYKKKCEIILINFNNYLQIIKQYDLDIVEKALNYCARVFRFAFASYSIMGRVEENKFVIVPIKNVDPHTLRAKVEETLNIALRSYTINSNITGIFNIKVSMYFDTINNLHYQRLYNNALSQLDNALGNTLIIDNIKHYFKRLNDVTFVDTEYDNETHEYTHFVEMVCANQNKEKTDYIINNYLNHLLKYYDAFSSFVLIKKDDVYNIPYYCEVLDQEVDINNTFNVSDVPYLTKILNTVKTVKIPNDEFFSGVSEKEAEIIASLHLSSSHILPLIDKNKVIGYLFVNGIGNNFSSTYDLNICGSYISLELSKARLEQNAEEMYELDDLTKVYNKIKLKKRFDELKYFSYNSVGVASIGINNIPMINLKFGSHYGSKIIVKIAEVIKKQFGKEEVFRNDSTNFMIICGDISFEKFRTKLENIKAEINKRVKNLITIGYTWTDEDIDVLKMYSNAEELMKINQSPNNVSNNDIEANAYAELVELVKNGNFKMYLQPKFDMKTGKCCGSEALVRLIHPEFGFINPGKFIPQLEEANFISVVDIYILECACKALRKWLDLGYDVKPISINYSRLTLLEEGIVEKTLAMLKKYDISKDLIEIEITETVGNIEKRVITDLVNKFTLVGIPIALDDFGSKYSALATVISIPFQTLKLDKSIVNDIVSNYRTQVLVKHLVELSQSLNMEVVAEGIETDAQFQILCDLGCQKAQGFLFERPVSENDFEVNYVFQNKLI